MAQQQQPSQNKLWQLIFEVPGVPKPQPKSIFGTDTDNPRTPIAVWRSKTAHVAKVALKKQQRGIPFQGPLRLTVTYIFPRNQGQLWKNKLMPRIILEKSPDLTNLDKALEDACNGVIFKDDKQIVSKGEQWKFYAACEYNRHLDRFEEEMSRAIVVLTEVPKDFSFETNTLDTFMTRQFEEFKSRRN